MPEITPDPVTELRDAARLMRERAQAATSGPWETPPECPGEITYGYRREGSSHIATWIATIDVSDEDISEAELGANAEHIASMHPGVALAVADWLDRFADPFYCYGPAEFGHALAVARAYLAEVPGDES